MQPHREPSEPSPRGSSTVRRRAELLRLSDHVRLDVVYDDTTPLGSMISGRCERAIQSRVATIAAYRRRHGLAATVAESERLLDEAMSAGRLGDFFDDRGRLRHEHVHPSPSRVTPVALRVEIGGAAWTVPLSAALVADLARWLGDWQRGVAAAPLAAAPRELWSALSAAGALTTQPPRPRCSGDALFVGHATVRIGKAGESVIIDPFLLPLDDRDPRGYSPFTASELGADAAFITHSHPDHFDLGTLLRLGADNPIHVPEVDRESILSVDMAARLDELGFREVRTHRPFDERNVGETRVVALPFFGEQPTSGERRAPHVRNVGSTYLVEACGRRYALVADAGADGEGTTTEVAASALARYGAADVVFGGYRSWAVYPIRYLFSSVARYLLFVPRARWMARQKIMHDADDLLDLAELWQARCVVPYADGGAPWYWRRGLGPRLDEPGADNPHLDPRPERVSQAAKNRSHAAEGGVASPVAVTVLRPGQRLGSRLEPISVGGRTWPFTQEASP